MNNIRILAGGTMGTTAPDAVRAVIERAIAAAPIPSGIEVEDVTVTKAGRRELIRVVVDRDGGIDLDAVADVSRLIADALDDPTAASIFTTAYVLEVTSPGVDRPLREPKHWRRSIARLVHITRKDGPEIEGRITAADDTSVTLSLDDLDEPLVLPYAEIDKAVVQVEFNRAKDDTIEEGSE
jgi:ribosome maturation factor RimP